VSRIDHTISLRSLIYAENCDWRSLPSCLPGTRTDILSKILGWVHAYRDSPSAEVFLLTGLAGSGKSALARSIAQGCYDENILLSSFFFVKDVAHKNDPNALISTIAYDLGRADANFARDLSTILKSSDGRRLVSKGASVLWQFEEMLLKACHNLSANRPFTVVIDALDEVVSDQLLQLLGNKVNQLPREFRLIVTSRPDSNITHMLSKKAHIHTAEMDIEGETNWTDIRMYVRHRANLLVERYESLDEGWPGDELLDNFVDKAEGLFLWAATVFDYLGTVVDPSKTFVAFISESGTSTRKFSVEGKMDIIYGRILECCNWEDPDFVLEYDRMMGTIMAARIPLSARALHSIWGETAQVPIATILNPLRSLLDGVGTESRAIRILHQSLRDFITVRARNLPNSQKYYVSVEKHSDVLALHCLNVMNEQLPCNMPGVRYLSSLDSDLLDGIPELRNGTISEELSYACKFWMKHLEKIQNPSNNLTNSLNTFLSQYAIHWIEIAAMQGSSGTLKNVWQWIDVSLNY